MYIINHTNHYYSILTLTLFVPIKYTPMYIYVPVHIHIHITITFILFINRLIFTQLTFLN